MGELYRVRATMTGWTGSPGLYTAYFDASAGISPSNAATVAGRVRGAWDVYKSVLATVQTVQVQSTVDVLDDESGALVGSVTVAPPALVIGTAATAFVGPAQVMGPLILDTGFIVDGRRLRGRQNLGPVAATQTNFDVPPTGLKTAINAFGVALIEPSIAGRIAEYEGLRSRGPPEHIGRHSLRSPMRVEQAQTVRVLDRVIRTVSQRCASVPPE